MNFKTISKKINKAKRPKDLFTNVLTEDDLKKQYRQMGKLTHPDLFLLQPDILKEAEDVFKRLHDFYEQGLDELGLGIFNEENKVKLYEANANMLFDFETSLGHYKFYEQFDAEVSSIFKGVCDKECVVIKIIKDPDDNPLIINEFKILENLSHHSLPVVLEQIKINDNAALIMQNIEGETLNDLLERYNGALSEEPLLWMLERLLSVLGYLHSNFIIHGNIQPDNIIINKYNHNVGLTGFCFGIQKANEPTAQYQIKNDYSSPRISKSMKVDPRTDIYSLGKVAIKILGGDIESTGMPIDVNVRIRNFIRSMLDEKNALNSDAWRLWDKLRTLRTELYGDKRFVTLD